MSGTLPPPPLGWPPRGLWRALGCPAYPQGGGRIFGSSCHQGSAEASTVTSTLADPLPATLTPRCPVHGDLSLSRPLSQHWTREAAGPGHAAWGSATGAQVPCSFSEAGTVAPRPRGHGAIRKPPTPQLCPPQGHRALSCQSTSSRQPRVRVMADLDALGSGGPGRTAVLVPLNSSASLPALLRARSQSSGAGHTPAALAAGTERWRGDVEHPQVPGRHAKGAAGSVLVEPRRTPVRGERWGHAGLTSEHWTWSAGSLALPTCTRRRTCDPEAPVRLRMHGCVCRVWAHTGQAAETTTAAQRSCAEEA